MPCHVSGRLEAAAPSYLRPWLVAYLPFPSVDRHSMLRSDTKQTLGTSSTVVIGGADGIADRAWMSCAETFGCCNSACQRRGQVSRLCSSARLR